MAPIRHTGRMELTRKDINQLERAVVQVFKSTLGWGAYKATVYLSDKIVVRATSRMKPDRRSSRAECVVTYGEPNFVERRFIRLCKKAGEPLPVRKVQIKHWPKK